MGVFTTIACLLAIAAILNFVNDRYLHLQPDIGLLLMAGLTTAGLRIWKSLFLSGSSIFCTRLHPVLQSQRHTVEGGTLLRLYLVSWQRGGWLGRTSLSNGG